jgi:Straboviridae/Ackermannviridae/Kyanoviridae exonuclease subunit 1
VSHALIRDYRDVDLLLPELRGRNSLRKHGWCRIIHDSAIRDSAADGLHLSPDVGEDLREPGLSASRSHEEDDMTKVAIIADTHFGARSESKFFMDEAEQFFSEQFFPELKRQEIRTVVHLGDLVDRRKYVAFSTSNRMNKAFVDGLLENHCMLHVIPGNHDLPFKNLTSINAERELLPDTVWFRIYDAPTVTLIHGRSVMMLPWICDENRERSMAQIDHGAAEIVMSHLELSGFEQYRGKAADKGMSPKMFERFGLVLSGHYHHPSRKGNIQYVGAPYEMTWSDHLGPRGFNVLDLDTLEMEFYENPRQPHQKIIYDEAQEVGYNNLADPEVLQGKILKVIVRKREKPLEFDNFIRQLEKAGVESIRVVEDHKHMDAVPDEEVAVSLSDPRQIMLRCAEEMGPQGYDVEALKALMTDLYDRAMEVDA